MVDVHVDISDAMKRMGKLAGTPAQMATAFKRAARETESHAKSFIARQIAGEYAVSQSDVKGGSDKGAVDVRSRVTDTGLEITYTGRTLTLAHFPYSPKTHTKRNYTVKGTIKRGARKAIGKNVFIGSTGAKNTEKTQSIPFKRLGKERLPIMPVYTLSVPQMITNEKLEPAITEDITSYLLTRFLHQYDVIMRGIVKGP